MYPYPNPSLLSRGITFFKNIKWATLLDGTQKTLGVINQAIPIVYQVKPMVSNARTLLKIASGLNSPTTTVEEVNKTPIKTTTTNNSPVFYL